MVWLFVVLIAALLAGWLLVALRRYERENAAAARKEVAAVREELAALSERVRVLEALAADDERLFEPEELEEPPISDPTSAASRTRSTS